MQNSNQVPVGIWLLLRLLLSRLLLSRLLLSRYINAVTIFHIVFLLFQF